VQKAQQASARYEQAKAGLVRGWAALQRVRHGEPGICAAEHRGALFRPLPWGTAYGNSHKRNKRSGRGLLRLESELR